MNIDLNDYKKRKAEGPRAGWSDKIFAAFIFFTRLPFWRLHQPPREAYATVVEHWPLTGWLTGGAMALTLWGLCSISVPLPLAIIAAFLVRLLITGALHEDGLADFVDGFGGGGSDRERILSIMKDSRIGTYGVLGLIVYFAIWYACIKSVVINAGVEAAAVVLFAGDAYSKMISAQLIQLLPYARTAETAKNRVVYRKINVQAGVSLFIQGALPMVPYFYIMGLAQWSWIVFVPCIVMYFLYLLMLRRLHGYTGDCCGATFLITELSFIITNTIILS